MKYKNGIEKQLKNRQKSKNKNEKQNEKSTAKKHCFIQEICFFIYIATV